MILFWIVSLPVLAESVVGAWWDLYRTDYVVETFRHLGYPLYFLTIMGIAKVLAVAAIVGPAVFAAITMGSWALRPASRRDLAAA